MNKQWFIRGLVALGMMGALLWKAQAGFNESQDVNNTNGDPSPSVAGSKVNDYRFQPEQINLKPTDGLVKVLRTDQKNLVNDFVDAVIPIRSAVPREIRNVMRQVTALEGGRAEVIQDKKTGEKFLQIVAPRYMIPYLRDAMAALDVPWLKEYWDGATDLYVRAIHRNAADVDKFAKQYGGSEATSVIDTANNAVRRYDEDYRINEYKKAVTLVDIPANQVLLDVNIYEINTNNDLKIGLDYINWKNGPGRNLWSFIESGYGGEQHAKGLTSIVDPLLDARLNVPGNTVRQVLDTAATEGYRAANFLWATNYVDFLQNKGKARLVKSQQIMVASSKTATLSADEEVLAFFNNDNSLETVTPGREPGAIERNNGEVTAPFQDWSRRLHYQRKGVVTTALTVTPYVGLSSMELDLDLQVGSQSGEGEQNGISPNGLPIINFRTVKTTVRLLDGQPYVIAGMKRMHKIKTSARVPFLGAIPILGYLFGGETTLRRDNDIIVTVTPHFHLSNMVGISTPLRVKTLENIIVKDEKVELPKPGLGYDQWLMGGAGGKEPKG